MENLSNSQSDPPPAEQGYAIVVQGRRPREGTESLVCAFVRDVGRVAAKSDRRIESVDQTLHIVREHQNVERAPRDVEIGCIR